MSGDPDPRPDILVVVADDMRWDLMSGQGHPFLNTPNLDAFANEAALMKKAFVPVALCSPSRAAILTGREPHQASAPGIAYRNNSFLETQRTFAEDLQAAGYFTAYIGKWHLGDGAKPQRGFDHWESFDWLGDFDDPTVHVNGVRNQYAGYVDDVLSARADMLLEAHADSAKPVFLMIGLKAPHLQFEHPERHSKAFEDVGIPTPDTYDEDFSVSGKLPAVKEWLGMNEFHCGLSCFGGDWDTYIKDHYRAILGLDDSVGTLRAATRHRGKRDNTLFIYTSDNGYSLGDHGLTEKHMVYEEPVRVPFLIDFPGSTDRGFTFDGLVSTLDIAPTALDYAGVAQPARMTGRSLRPLVEPVAADTARDWRDSLFLTYDDRQIAVRTDRYKYIEALDVPGHIELYDLQEDPRETRTVHDDPAYADVLADMDARLDAAIASNGWSMRERIVVTAVKASRVMSRTAAERLAIDVSQAGTDVEDEDNGWRTLRPGDGGFALADAAPAGSSVLVALPIRRLSEFDPFVKLFVRAGWQASLLVDGREVWNDHERLPINHANPPLLEADTLAVLRFDGEGTLRLGLTAEAPEGTIELPLGSEPLAAAARPSVITGHDESEDGGHEGSRHAH